MLRSLIEKLLSLVVGRTGPSEPATPAHGWLLPPSLKPVAVTQRSPRR